MYMIVPLVSEETWLELLRAVPEWEPPTNRLLFISPHPDDETLAAGGLIAAQRLRGVEVILAAVTDGENAYTDSPELGRLREREQVDALNRLGMGEEKIVRFGLPDSDVASHLEELVELLMPLASRDTHILAPWAGDFHPDHIACGSAAEEVARRTGAALTSYFFWTWHRGNADALDGMHLRSFPLSCELLETKLEALSCHRSQLIHESGEPILPESLLDPAKRPFEVFLVS
jgi:LmbE family N-acetylglucosaminyl deacetylase